MVFWVTMLIKRTGILVENVQNPNHVFESP